MANLKVFAFVFVGIFIAMALNNYNSKKVVTK